MLLSIKKNPSFWIPLIITVLLGSVNSAHAQNKGAAVVGWDDLIQEGYGPDSIMEKYQDELDRLGDSEDEGLYAKITAELNSMPANKALNNKRIKLAGFIAPLGNQNNLITEFLLVPYFGACIHVPPPPINQIVLVQVAPGNGIKQEDAFAPFWVSGEIEIAGTKTDIGESGYRIRNAGIEIYRDETTQ